MAKPGRFASLFNRQPGERRLLASFILQYFLLGAAYNFAQTAAFLGGVNPPPPTVLEHPEP